MSINWVKRLEEDSSGKFSRQKWIQNHIPEFLTQIDFFCKKYNLEDLPFKEQVYLFVHCLENRPKCRNKDCQNQTKYKNSTLGYLSYCSIKCISSDDSIKESKRINSKLKWGTNTPAESEEIKKKIIETNKGKWGVNSPLQNVEIQKKSRKTLNENWGVDNPSQNSEIVKRRVETFTSKIDSIREKYKNTSLQKWGVEHPWMNRDVHKKTIQKFYEGYTKRILEKIDPNKYTFLGFDKEVDTTHLKFNCNECGNDFDILTYQFYMRIGSKTPICTKCHPISSTSSIKQEEILQFIKNNWTGDIITSDTTQIYPRELDFYFPSLGVAFEFNGVFCHSSRFKSKEYHKEKWDSCTQKEIKLYTIWEDDYLLKRDIVESFILNKLGLSKAKVWARKCNIKEVSYPVSRDFLDRNHLQGDCKSSVRLGLYFGDELISLMCFSKIRLPISRKGGEGIWEMTRFCSKNFTNCVGGASKLLHYFTKNYPWIQIQTYSDNMISDGALYEKLGFSHISTSQPGYWYLVNGIRKHRFNYRKRFLVKRGYDSTKTEREITEELGLVRIWNSGNKKWVLNNN